MWVISNDIIKFTIRHLICNFPPKCITFSAISIRIICLLSLISKSFPIHFPEIHFLHIQRFPIIRWFPIKYKENINFSKANDSI